MVAPWAIFSFWVVRSSIYEMNTNLFNGLRMFDLVELLYRIKEKERTDQKYERMKKVGFFWMKVTAAWWVFCFIGYFTIGLAYEVFSKYKKS